MKNKYPRDIDVFRQLWENVEKLCKNKRLIAPVEVLKEIKQGDDELTKWIKKMKIFIEPDEFQLAKVSDVLKNFSFLAKAEKTSPNADPWIIALAIVNKESESKKLLCDDYIVVTEESKTRKDRIPEVCRKYNIECINLIELFRREKW